VRPTMAGGARVPPRGHGCDLFMFLCISL
jgi:hypothetical protein